MRNTRPSWCRIGGVLVAVALATSPLSPTFAYAASKVMKSETVHVQTNAEGAVSSVTVEDLLSNDDKADRIDDRSNLTGISATDEDQSFKVNGDGTLTWTTNGKQVGYKGTSSQQPPVSVRVSYTLDGTPAKPSELAGASGHLVMRIDYQNDSVATKTIEGSQREVKTPFLCMTVAMLDSDIFSNVAVTNGKLIDDKGGLAVVGMAMPGLQQSLDLSDEDIDLDIPEYLQIEADVTELALDPIYTVVTPELFGDLSSDDLKFGPDELGEGTDALTDAMNQLIDGASLLDTTVHQIADGSGKVGAGIAEFKEKIAALPSGMQALATGATELRDALGQAKSTADMLAQASAGLAGIDSAAMGIDGAKDALGTADGAVTALQSAAETTLSDAASAARSARDAATSTRDGLETSKEPVATELAEVSDALKALDAVDTSTWTEEQKAALATAKESVAQAQEQLAGIAIAQESLDALSTATTALENAGTGSVGTAAQDAHDRIGEAAAALDTSSQAISGAAGTAEQLSGGLKALSTGLSGAAGGAGALADGLGGLSATAPQVVEGVNALGDGVGQLTSALQATGEGTSALHDGLTAFNDEGINKVIDGLNELDDSFAGISDRLEALRDTASEYDTFSGKLDGQSGSVRFIYKTERIG